MKILILGANGMLGHVIFNYLTLKTKWKIFGTVRSKNKLNKNIHRNLYLFDLSEKKKHFKNYKYFIPKSNYKLYRCCKTK